jgi:hypothetical protein
MDEATFYTTTTQVSFALLGFWWVVVEFKHDRLMSDRLHRRMAYDVSLHFLLPGVMSVMALLTDGAPLLWRTVFAVAALTGAAASLSVMRAVRNRPQNAVTAAIRWLFIVGYLLIALFAAAPTLSGSMGMALEPLQVEGFLVSVILFLDVNLAWSFFAQPES